MLVKRISTSSSCILTGHRSTIVKLIQVVIGGGSLSDQALYLIRQLIVEC